MITTLTRSCLAAISRSVAAPRATKPAPTISTTRSKSSRQVFRAVLLLSLFCGDILFRAMSELCCCKQDVANLLIRVGVDLNNNRFLILQGEVEQIAMMKPKAPNPHTDGNRFHGLVLSVSWRCVLALSPFQTRVLCFTVINAWLVLQACLSTLRT